VEIGASYQGKIYDYWIFGKLSNGKKIKIFDYKPHNLSRYRGEVISMLILAFAINEIELKAFMNSRNGIYLNKIKGKLSYDPHLLEDWLEIIESNSFNEDLKKGGYFLEYERDYFLISSNELKNKQIKNGKDKLLSVGRFDLLAWKK